MRKFYRIANKGDTRNIAEFLARHGEHLLPMVDLIEESRMAVEERIDLFGSGQYRGGCKRRSKTAAVVGAVENRGTVRLRVCRVRAVQVRSRYALSGL